MQDQKKYGPWTYIGIGILLILSPFILSFVLNSIMNDFGLKGRKFVFSGGLVIIGILLIFVGINDLRGKKGEEANNRIGAHLAEMERFQREYKKISIYLFVFFFAFAVVMFFIGNNIASLTFLITGIIFSGVEYFKGKKKYRGQK